MFDSLSTSGSGIVPVRHTLHWRRWSCPKSHTRRAAARDKKEGKSPSTQAGEYVHEEIEHVREGKHGARSTKQAIAIGLSKARRDGVKVQARQVRQQSNQKEGRAG